MSWSARSSRPTTWHAVWRPTACRPCIASFTNSFPDTAFAENVGLVGLTKVRSRWVVTTCGVLLLIMGLIPKIGQIIADLPGPVIGGGATVMFAMVTAVGIQTLHKVNFEGNHNLLIVASSLAVGLLPAFDPHFYDKFPKDFQVIFGSSITATVIVVFVAQPGVQPLDAGRRERIRGADGGARGRRVGRRARRWRAPQG